MAKLTEKQMENRKAKISDRSLPLSERKKAYKELMDVSMNPKEVFNPATFDPFDTDDNYDVKKRDRVAPPPRMPTMGLLPKQLLEGQMVGMFESKQDLYLIMAYYINNLLDRIEELEKKK